jgi:hypothetical protein
VAGGPAVDLSEKICGAPTFICLLSTPIWETSEILFQVVTFNLVG